MKHFLAVIACILFLSSFRHERNQNFWIFSSNESRLIDGNTFRDTIIEIKMNSLLGSTIFNFNLFLCGGNRTHNFTQCFLTTKDSIRYITSALETGTSINGYISSRRFLDILKESKQQEFLFECKFRGIEAPWSFFKIKIVN